MQVKIRLDKNSGHIQIPIYVNEKGPYYFTLDTGAGATAVSKTLTENLKLSLSPDNRAKAVGVGGSAPVPVMRSTVDQLRIGSEILENENVVVLDFESIFGAMWTSSGLIGQSILKNYKVTINYRDLILNLDRNHDLRSEEDVLIDWVPFKYVGNTHIIAVPVHINNKGPYDLILDTGSSGTILSPKLVAELGLEQNSTEIEEDQKKKGVDVCSVGGCPGVGGVVKGYQIKLDRLSIKSATQEKTTIDVIDLKLITPKCQILDQGVIGYPFLKDFIVILDYPNMRLGLIKQREYN